MRNQIMAGLAVLALGLAATAASANDGSQTICGQTSAGELNAIFAPCLASRSALDSQEYDDEMRRGDRG